MRKLRMNSFKILKYVLIVFLVGAMCETLPILSYADTALEASHSRKVPKFEPFLRNFNYEGPFQQDLFTVPQGKLLAIEQVSIHAVANHPDPLNPADFGAGLSTDSVSIQILFGAAQFLPQDKPVPGLPPRTGGTTSQLVKFYVLPGQTLRMFVGISGHPEISLGADIGIVGHLIDND